MTDPQTQSQAGTGGTPLPPLPALPASGQEVFDMIMGRIEPELTSAQRPSLTQKYQGETPEQAKARAERYQKAFEEYDKQYAAYMQSVDGTLRGYQRGALKGIEQNASGREETNVASLESQISQQ